MCGGGSIGCRLHGTLMSVAALAAKLVKKEQVAAVMKQHGTHRASN
jgi:hypothetical protein